MLQEKNALGSSVSNQTYSVLDTKLGNSNMHICKLCG